MVRMCTHSAHLSLNFVRGAGGGGDIFFSIIKIEKLNIYNILLILNY